MFTTPVFSAIFSVAVLMAPSASVAQAATTESNLREALLRHFSQDNLVPIFLPRGHEVGDVLEASGAVYAKRSHCFPGLKLGAQQASDSLREMSLALKAEGNFGIGLKQIVEIFASTKASSSTRLTLSFSDQTYISASTLELQKAFSRKNCPFLVDIVENKAIAAAKFGSPLLVLQEIFYAKKRLSIEVDKGAGLNAALKNVEGVAKPLNLNVDFGVEGATGNSVTIIASTSVPIAARIAFVPRPISGALLGGGGTPTVYKYYWQSNGENQVGDVQGMAVLYKEITNATANEANPLLMDQ